MSVVEAPFQPHDAGFGVFPCECVEDQGPGRESVFTPPFRGRQALVGAAAHAVGYPLSQRVIVWWRPSAVLLEPSVSVAHGSLGIHRQSVALPRPAPAPVSRRHGTGLRTTLFPSPANRSAIQGSRCFSQTSPLALAPRCRASCNGRRVRSGRRTSLSWFGSRSTSRGRGREPGPARRRAPRPTIRPL